MSLLCRLKGHSYNSAGVCSRCGERCEHRNLDESDPCVKKCLDCKRTFIEHEWEEYGEPGNRRCVRCGTTTFNPLENTNWKAKKQGKIYVTGNLKPDQNRFLTDALKYAVDSEYDLARKASIRNAAEAVKQGYIDSGQMNVLIEAADKSVKMYSSVPAEMWKYTSLRDALLSIAKLYDGIQTD